jgi:mono/diheme cytochrome c family protein
LSSSNPELNFILTGNKTMKKALKYITITGTCLILIILAVATYIKLGLPRIPVPTDITAPVTADRVERGSYLANHVAVCMDCHSTRDWTLFSGPPLKGADLGGGGAFFGKEAGFPGSFYAPNITPFSLSGWSDGEIYRAITAGVSKDGRALFPVMPYHSYGRLDKEDIVDIIAYLRTLAPVENSVPLSQPDFPFNFIINTMPREPASVTRPSPQDPLQYGAYLVQMAGCVDCHSKREKGEIVAGSEFGGGMEFRQPAGIIRAPNITPDPETGIGSWSKQSFIRKFRQYADSTYQVSILSEHDLNSPMPWTMYGGMEEKDLEAIYDYLASLKPVKNDVQRYGKK